METSGSTIETKTKRHTLAFVRVYMKKDRSRIKNHQLQGIIYAYYGRIKFVPHY